MQSCSVVRPLLSRAVTSVFDFFSAMGVFRSVLEQTRVQKSDIKQVPLPSAACLRRGMLYHGLQARASPSRARQGWERGGADPRALLFGAGSGGKAARTCPKGMILGEAKSP